MSDTAAAKASLGATVAAVAFGVHWLRKSRAAAAPSSASLLPTVADELGSPPLFAEEVDLAGVPPLTLRDSASSSLTDGSGRLVSPAPVLLDAYTVSDGLRALLGPHAPAPGAPLRADALVQLLLDADAIGLASQASRHDAVDALETAEDAAKAKAKNRWQRMLKPAILAGKSTQDPWREFEVHKRKTELCVRHDYDAKHDKWHTSETLVKMEDAPFAHGAMRECYRMKKMSQARHSCGRHSCGRNSGPRNSCAIRQRARPLDPIPPQMNAHFFYNMDWSSCHNYVAKKYIKADTPKEVYFSDIAMQMTAKMYARKYNTQAPPPPKRVDFLQAFVIEVVRPGGVEYYCVERAIESGTYIKHNTNSGFVQMGDEHRATPHCFSRFSYAASGGKLIVVDIQGVDDIFTDPQIHTRRGDDFGDGNLGISGMALFFSTSRYDALCKALRLQRFALSQAELKRIEAKHAEDDDGGGGGSQDTVGKQLPALARQLTGVSSHNNMQTLTACDEAFRKRKSSVAAGRMSTIAAPDTVAVAALPLHLFKDECADGAAAPAAALREPNPTAAVHARLCEYNLSGQLPLQGGAPDIPSAGFHLVCAAAGGDVRALRDVRSLAQGLSADVLLPGVSLAAGGEAALEKLLPSLTARLAAAGDVAAMVEVANAAAADGRAAAAAAWVRLALEQEGGGDAAGLGGTARYQLLERLAELLADSGDTAAAAEQFEAASEAAMEAGKTKLAMKLADRAAQLAPEDD